MTRTMIATVVPFSATDLTLRIIISDQSARQSACLLGNFDSLVFDYLARQSVAGMRLLTTSPNSLGYSASVYTDDDTLFVSARVSELVYTASDLDQFGCELGLKLPFLWDISRRFHLQAEIDAYYAHLYGLTRDELRYILDPRAVFGDDFPSETFRVLKEREIKEYGHTTRATCLRRLRRTFKSDRFRGEMPKRVSAIEVPAKPTYEHTGKL